MLLVSCALILGYVHGRLEVPADLEHPRAVERADVHAEDFSDRHTVVMDVSLHTGSRATVHANGILTSSSCEPDTAITSGASTFAVDGIPLINLFTPHPLWRTLDVDARGADVREVQSSFAGLGFRGAIDGIMGPETIAFFNGLRRAAASDAPAAAGIAPSDVVWLGGASVTGAHCPVPVGSVLASGDVVAELPPRISALRLGTLPVVLPDLPRTVVIDGVTAAVNEKGDVDSQAWPAVAATRSFEAYLADPKAVTVKGDVELTTAIQVAQIPPSSIFGTHGERGCVSDGSRTYEGEIVSSELGYTLMRFESATPAETLLDPAPEQTCP